MKKRIVSILMTICMAVAIVPASMSFTTAEADAATMSQADKMVRIAASYQGKGLNGVKKAMKKDGYTLWNPSYDYAWCAWFVANCAKAAGISTKDIPHYTYADGYGYSGWAKNKGIFKKQGSYTPSKGDLIFFDWGSSSIAHVEMVSGVKNGKVYTIGGNTGSGIVNARSWSLKDSNINGYAKINYSKTYTINYQDNLYSTKNDASVVKSQTATCGQKITLRTEKFKRSGYSYSTYTIVRWINGEKYAFCRDKATKQTVKWFKCDSVPSSYYKVQVAPGSKLMLGSSYAGVDLYLFAQWKKDAQQQSTAASSSSSSSASSSNSSSNSASSSQTPQLKTPSITAIATSGGNMTVSLTGVNYVKDTYYQVYLPGPKLLQMVPTGTKTVSFSGLTVGNSERVYVRTVLKSGEKITGASSWYYKTVTVR